MSLYPETLKLKSPLPMGSGCNQGLKVGQVKGDSYVWSESHCRPSLGT